jgi:PAS domain S-box-containing protein
MNKAQSDKKLAQAKAKTPGEKTRGQDGDVARLKRELAQAGSQLEETRHEAAVLRADLSSANRDMENLLKPMEQPLVIVDHHLKIKRFNPAANKIFDLSPSDVQKDITLIGTRIPMPDLGQFLRRSMESQQTLEKEILAGGEIYAMRIFPYLDAKGGPMGALLRFVEKTGVVQAERERSSIGYIAQLFMLYDNLDDFYRELPRVLSQRLNYPYALLELFDGEHEESVLVGCCGFDEADGGQPRHPLPGSVAGWVIQSGRTYIHGRGQIGQQVYSLPLGGLPVETLVAAPLRVKDAVLGVITLADHRKREVTDHLVETLEVVGINAGLGIERRRAQQTVMQATTEALLESLDRYRKIVNTANEGIWIVNQRLRTEFANPQMAHMLGYQPEEIRNKSAFHFIPLEDRKDALRKWRRTHEGLQESSDWRLLRKDGSQLWALISTSPLYDEEGRFSGALGMVADITHRKKSEQELLDHRQKLRALASELTMVEERERRRIASDMHDGVGHLLAAIKLRLDMLKEAFPNNATG